MNPLLKRLFFWLTIISLLLDVDYLHGLSKDQAIIRCRDRLTSLTSSSNILPNDHHRACFLDASKRVEEVIVKLQQTSTANEIYELSSKCHGALHAMEWLLSEYGNTKASPLDDTNKSFVKSKTEESSKTLADQNSLEIKKRPLAPKNIHLKAASSKNLKKNVHVRQFKSNKKGNHHKKLKKS